MFCYLIIGFASFCLGLPKFVQMVQSVACQITNIIFMYIILASNSDYIHY